MATLFKVLWSSSNKTWVSYPEIAGLEPIKSYLEAMGVENISALKHGTATPPNDPQVFVGSLEVGSGAYLKAGRQLISSSPKIRDTNIYQFTFSFRQQSIHQFHPPPPPFSVNTCGSCSI